MHTRSISCGRTWNDRYCLWPDKAPQSRAAVRKRAAERGALIMPMRSGRALFRYVRRQATVRIFECGH